MTENPSLESDNNGPDSADVVDGPVGSASLKDPATSGPIGGNVDALRPIDVPSESTPEIGAVESPPPPHERQDEDHIGVDWDLSRHEPHGKLDGKRPQVGDAGGTRPRTPRLR
jgi:hypothetical protein